MTYAVVGISTQNRTLTNAATVTTVKFYPVRYVVKVEMASSLEMVTLVVETFLTTKVVTRFVYVVLCITSKIEIVAFP